MSSYLLVHGACGGGWVWDDVAERLEKAGHRVRVVGRLPSAGTDPGSLRDLTADAHCVRQLLDTIDERVVLVGHSYGGMVITELADHPKVRHSVYLAAFWPQRGQSLLDLLGDAPLPNWFIQRDDGALEFTDDFELGVAVRRPGPEPRPRSALARCAAVGGGIWCSEHGTSSGTPNHLRDCRSRFGQLRPGARAGSDVEVRRLRGSVASRTHGAAFSAR